MAINWLIALKAVPWTDLVQAAPTIVKGARKLYTSVRGGAAEAASSRRREGSASDAGLDAEGRIEQLEDRLSALAAEQQASAEVIRNLAEQNARLIDAVGIMGARARILFIACIASWIAMMVLTVWVLTR